MLQQQPGAPGRGCINTQREPVRAELYCFEHTCAASQQTPSERVGMVIAGVKLGSKQSHQRRRHLHVNTPGKVRPNPRLFCRGKAQEARAELAAQLSEQGAGRRGRAPGQQKDHVKKHLDGIAQT